MRIALALGLLAALPLVISPVIADEYVNGYFRQNGTYVQPYYRSPPDGNPFNNYSTQGNTNPYTGQPGTHNPYGSSFGSPYGSGGLNPYGR